jgi:putative tricarboxylic transport membrane protein
VKLDDSIWGAALVLFSAALFLHVRTFPNIPGQQVGPAALPGALAVGLAACGAILFVRGLRARSAGAARGEGRPGWVELPAWFASPRQVLGFAALVGVNGLYLLAVDRLGFILTGIVYLWVLMAVLRVPVPRALVIAIVMTLAIHYAFYKLLKVPLPWGLLQSFAW